MMARYKQSTLDDSTSRKFENKQYCTNQAYGCLGPKEVKIDCKEMC